MPICPKCGNQAADNAVFCDQCGTKLSVTEPPPEQETLIEEPIGSVPENVFICPACGAENVPGEVFCDVCGEPLESPEPVVEEAVVEEQVVEEPIIEEELVAEEEVIAEPIIEEELVAEEEVIAEPIIEEELVAEEEVIAEPIIEEELVAEEEVIEAEPVIEVEEELYCPTCGAAVDPDDTFCGSCGASLAGAPVEEILPEEPIIEEEPVEEVIVEQVVIEEEPIEEEPVEEIVEEAVIEEGAVEEVVAEEEPVEEIVEEAVIEEELEQVIVEELVKEPKCPVCSASVLPDQAFCASCGAALKPVAEVAPEPVVIAAPSGPYLAVVDSGAHIPLIDQPELLIGREDDISGIYPEIDMTPHGGEEGGISRRHAKLIHEGDTWFIVDLDSTNGTYVNGNELAPKTRHPLNDGDGISLGDIEATFHTG